MVMHRAPFSGEVLGRAEDIKRRGDAGHAWDVLSEVIGKSKKMLELFDGLRRSPAINNIKSLGVNRMTVLVDQEAEQFDLPLEKVALWDIKEKFGAVEGVDGSANMRGMLVR